VDLNSCSATASFGQFLLAELLKSHFGVVLGPLFFVSDDFVGLLDLVEFFLFLPLHRFICELVWVSLEDNLSVGRLDQRCIRVSGNTQSCVWIWW
jgi:hypothetical protein